MANFSGVIVVTGGHVESGYERFLFRMTLPLTDILHCVQQALINMHELTLETERLLETTRIHASLLARTVDCSVCGLTFNPSGDPQVHTSPPHYLPCRHMVCGTCLTSWLAKAGSCPVCRHKLTGRIFVYDETDFRNEDVARPILEYILHQGRLYLLTNPADVTYFGFHNRDLVGDNETLELMFNFFSTTFEDSAIQGPLGQDFKTGLWERNAAGLTAALAQGLAVTTPDGNTALITAQAGDILAYE